MIQVLSKDQNYSMFKEAFIEQGLVNLFWDDYQRTIVVSIFFPFVLYALSILIFFSSYLSSGARASENPGQELTLNISSHVFTLAFIVIETTQMLDSKKEYFTSRFNWLDLVSLALNLMILLRFDFGKETNDVIITVAIILIWI